MNGGAVSMAGKKKATSKRVKVTLTRRNDYGVYEHTEVIEVPADFELATLDMDQPLVIIDTAGGGEWGFPPQHLLAIVVADGGA